MSHANDYTVYALSLDEHAGMQPGLRDGHLFSLFLMLPLAYVTLALLLFNWYPSQVRVDVPHSRCITKQGSRPCGAGLAARVPALLPPQEDCYLVT